MEITDYIARYLHIISAIAVLGGIICLQVAVLPLAKVLPSEERKKFRAGMQKKFMRVVHPAIMFLILTGAWQWYRNIEIYRKADPAQGLLGFKVLIALVMFTLVFIQASGVVSPKKAIRINLVLGLLVVLLAVIVRGARLAAMVGG